MSSAWPASAPPAPTHVAGPGPLAPTRDADLLVVDVDGTLLDAHSDNQGAAGTDKHGYGFYPLVAFLDRGLAPVRP